MPYLRSHYRKLLFASLAIATVTIALFASPKVSAQLGGSVPAFVRVQSITPGIAQTGNSNLTGKVKAGSFEGNGFLLSNLDSGKITSGTLAAARGGLGLDTSFANYGSTLWATGIGWSLLDPGTEGQVLSIVSGTPTWSDASSGSLTFPYDFTGDDGGSSALFRISNSGPNAAIAGNTDNPLGIGVLGTATDTSTYSFGGYFLAASPAGRAMYAANTSVTGSAIAGRFGSSSPDSVVIYATAGATTGDATAVFAESNADSGTGVIGVANYADSFTVGVEGRSPSGEGAGVFGSNTSASGRAAGVIGITSNIGSGYGIVSIGNLGVLGTKQFVIDHPLDPENKYLHHFCSEGPAPYNIYKGRIVTDATGYAWVTLPDYYAAINRDPDYQLTVLDSSEDFVLAKVTNEIRDNQFRIRTSKPHVTVCWEVKAIRNDRFIQAYGAPVETAKSSEERGKYQWPKLYGKPESQGIYYRASKRPKSEAPALRP